VTEIK